jgi:hypothetical protein
VSSVAEHVFDQASNGTLLVGSPFVEQDLGLLPAGGTLQVPFAIAASVAPPGGAAKLYMQAVMTDLAGNTYLSSPMTLVVLDETL